MPSDERNPTDPPPEGAIELVISEGLPAIFVNRFYVTANPSFTRIIFAERVVGDQRRDLARTVIVIPTADARELAELLISLIRSLDHENGSLRPTSDPSA
jgi:hypothetical protein